MADGEPLQDVGGGTSEAAGALDGRGQERFVRVLDGGDGLGAVLFELRDQLVDAGLRALFDLPVGVAADGAGRGRGALSGGTLFVRTLRGEVQDLGVSPLH